MLFRSHGAITNKFLLYAFPNVNLVAYISYNTNNGAVAALTIPFKQRVNSLDKVVCSLNRNFIDATTPDFLSREGGEINIIYHIKGD